jgi:hypothetical protein
MDHAVLVREGEPVGDLRGKVDGEVERHALLHALAQVDAVEQLHRHVQHLAFAADVVNCDDVGMVQPGGGLGLLLEAGLVLSALLLVGREEDGLHRDDAVEQRVLCLVHDAHGPAPPLFQDPLAAKLREVAVHFLPDSRRQTSSTKLSPSLLCRRVENACVTFISSAGLRFICSRSGA